MSDEHSNDRKIGGVAFAVGLCIILLIAAAIFTGRLQTPQTQTAAPTTTVPKSTGP